MGIRDWFRKSEPKLEQIEPVQPTLEELYESYTKWAIEIYDPEHQDPANLLEVLTVAPATLTGPYADPMVAMEMLESALDLLNEQVPDGTPLFTGRIRPILDHM